MKLEDEYDKYVKKIVRTILGGEQNMEGSIVNKHDIVHHSFFHTRWRGAIHHGLVKDRCHFPFY